MDATKGYLIAEYSLLALGWGCASLMAAWLENYSDLSLDPLCVLGVEKSICHPSHQEELVIGFDLPVYLAPWCETQELKG
eukprot:scaffold144725_cov58-Attheya_sp.AAC.2